MNGHLIWLWFWYTFGALIYMGKRAFYSIKPPNPVAHSLGEYLNFNVAGMPLLFRFVAESAVYWLCFSPQLLTAALTYFGWEKAAGTVAVITQYAPAALLFGLFADFIADWFIGTVVTKISFLDIKDWWPQMPGPMPQEAVVQAAIVETKVTSLQTITTPAEELPATKPVEAPKL